MNMSQEDEENKLTVSPPPKAEQLWLSLFFNILVPAFVLMKLSEPDKLGVVPGLLTALSFPLGYGIYDFIRRRKYNFISVLGFVSVLLTGGLGLMKLSGFWFAVKEAAVPLTIGVVLILSLRTKYPLVKVIFFNDTILNTKKIDEAILQNNAKEKFENVLKHCTYLISVSFLISAIINFVLAYVLLTSEPGTPEFNKELGYMNLISYPVILVFCCGLLMFALWKFLKNLQTLTGYEMEELFSEALTKPKKSNKKDDEDKV